MKLRISVMGRGYNTATDLPDQLDLAAGGTIADAIEAINSLLPPDHGLPGSCLVVLAGRHLGTVARHDLATLNEGDELVLIAPVAGG